MKALILKEASENPVFDLVDISEPTLPVDGVVLRVYASGICHHDLAVMDGTLKRGVKNNLILGHEISGTVVDTGSSVNGFEVGDQVVTMLTTSCGTCEICIEGYEYRCPQAHGIGHGIDGGLAEYVSARAVNLLKLPKGFDQMRACLLACPIGVSIRALRDIGGICSGQKVVVYGAGGGLGIHAAQIAAAAGAEVLGFTTSPHKLEGLERIGFGPVFLVSDGLDSAEVALAFTDDKGVDIVFNPVGSSVFQPALRSLALGGKMLVLGEVSGGDVSFSSAEMMFRDASIIGCTGAGLKHIKMACDEVASESVMPVVGEVLTLEEVSKAYHLMKSKEILGRVVVKLS